jgi:choline kinase
MKAVILAAGVGSRLGDPDLPKPLTLLVNGQSILELQLRHMAPFVSIDDIIVVVGYRKEEIMERHPDLLFVYNPRYEAENTSKSLMRALRKVHEDVLWINGDVIFHPSVMDKIISFDKTCMLVNQTDVGEEEVKYRMDAHGRILEVSKHIQKPLGEALGLNLFKADDLPSLKRNLAACSDSDYFERGIELSIQEGVSVWGVPVDTSLCAEIDFPEDLQRANTLLKEWQLNK